MASYELITVKGDNVTLGLLLWRRYKRRTDGAVEAAFALNPGIAAAGPYLTPGTVVKLPIIDLATAPPVVEAVRLWG